MAAGQEAGSLGVRLHGWAMGEMAEVATAGVGATQGSLGLQRAVLAMARHPSCDVAQKPLTPGTAFRRAEGRVEGRTGAAGMLVQHWWGSCNLVQVLIQAPEGWPLGPRSGSDSLGTGVLAVTWFWV